ncbi:MAG: FeoA family protein [Lachnospiraceae bacterium]|nr:FeoA family protein [Lachnospiraceae bacterium]MDD3659740.1 FeoA family protein [Lachnospiraceae bacterium]
MTLFDGMSGIEYKITGIYVAYAIERRLEALGLNEGTTIKIITRKKNGAMIIKVRGTRLAIGKAIAAGIEVKEV